MSAPHESEDDDRQLVHYLLGLLPADETERLDEASIVDGQVASRLRAVEDDLVDAYVRGRLSADTRQRFEAIYLSSPHRRRKVAFAEDFLGALTRAAPGAPPEAAPRDPGPELPRPRSSPWRWLAVAAMLMLVGGGLFFWEMRVRRALHQAQSESAAFERRARDLEQQLQNQHAANAETVEALERARASLAELTRPEAGDGAPGAVRPAATRVAFLLPPPTRAAGPLADMVVPAGTDSVVFDLQLDADDFPRYEAALREPGTDRVVWRSRRIAARSSGDRATVTAVVPGGMLRTQRYSIELSGYADGDAGQVVGVYVFRMVRR